MAKILMINLPYAGHVLPTLGAIRRLVENGHKITYLCAPEWEEQIKKTGAEFVPYINYPEHPDNKEKHDRCYLAAYTTGLKIGHVFDILFFEMYFFLGNTLAKQLGIPAVRFFTMQALDDRVVERYVAYGSIWQRSKRSRESITNGLAYGIERQEEERLYEIARCVPDINIVYNTEKFQMYRDTFDERYFFVGPALEAQYREIIPNPDIDEKLPLVYISFGTVNTPKLKIYRKLIRAFANKPVQVIISAGKLSDKIEKNLPKNICTFKRTAQLQVMEKTSLFINHGGLNGINEAMFYGVPMLVCPMDADQYINAEQVESLGIGKYIRKMNISSSKIWKYGKEIMESSSVAENVEKIRQITVNSPGNDYAASVIEDYLRKIKI